MNFRYIAWYTDGSLLYVAPDTGRQGMAQLEHALSRVNIVCVDKFPAPTEYVTMHLICYVCYDVFGSVGFFAYGSPSVFCRFYANPLVGDAEGDNFVLHFYDLSAKQPHTMYHFKWNQQVQQDSTAPDAESVSMETS